MLKSSQLVYIGLELVIAVLAVAGNVLVCLAVCLNSNLQSITNFFVVSLAVADIAVGLLAIPLAITIRYDSLLPSLPEVFCRFQLNPESTDVVLWLLLIELLLCDTFKPTSVLASVPTSLAASSSPASSSYSPRVPSSACLPSL